MCSSLSRAGGTAAGACMSRSCACWFIGKATISRMFGVSARSMTMRSMPGAVFERVEHAAEARLDLARGIAGDFEGLVHDRRQMVADGAGGELDAVADDVVLERLDRQRILGLERLEPALQHRERVVAELDLAGVLVALEHREIDDPAEAELAGRDRTELAADAGARRPGELCRFILVG